MTLTCFVKAKSPWSISPVSTQKILNSNNLERNFITVSLAIIAL